MTTVNKACTTQNSQHFRIPSKRVKPWQLSTRHVALWAGCGWAHDIQHSTAGRLLTALVVRPIRHSCSLLQSQATGMHLPPHAACRVMWHRISSALDDQEAKPSEFPAPLDPGDLLVISCSQTLSLKDLPSATTEGKARGFSTLKTHEGSPLILEFLPWGPFFLMLWSCYWRSVIYLPLVLLEWLRLALVPKKIRLPFLQVWFGLKDSVWRVASLEVWAQSTWLKFTFRHV